MVDTRESKAEESSAVSTQQEERTGAEATEAAVAAATTTTMTTTPLSTTEEVVVSQAPPEKKTRIIRRKRRPARVQVDPSTVKPEPPQTGTIYNIWYNKWAGGDREDQFASQTHAPSRCSVSRDSGYTRADRIAGPYFCLFFARGTCHRGQECEFLHRLPTIHDLFNPNIDCFGRDKHSDYKDDMSGVGSFMRQNRTLYVGRIHVTDDIEEVVARHFQEWGQIERIRVLTQRGVAFVTYTNEANAQFAKEAMSCQSLDHNEILNVRWATLDPNPVAQKREARRIEEQAAEAVRRALPAEFVAELEGRSTEASKRKKIEGTFGLSGYEPPDEVWYARTKELEQQHDVKQIEGSSQQALLTAPPPSATQALQAPQQPQATGGILSASTLAALSDHKGGPSIQKAVQASGGPLVGYGTDDDSG
ncbi:Pre-mRNA-splicing factor [Ascosphaera aggregata]|nr:Pre-mRNA-splicing factor [Ascosphaera aggregata]